MYMVKPPPPTPALSTGTNCATLRRPWWAIPEEDRLQMNALTRPSPNLEQKLERRYYVPYTTPLFIDGS